MSVRVDLVISLDGFATTSDGTPDDPIGQDWPRLVEAFTATRTFRARVLGDTSGAGTTGVDDRYAAASFEGVGAEIIGATMFGLHLYGDNPDWRGWWGEDPPFHVPVLVLTHEQRASLPMAGGTTFHFVSGTPHEVLALATAQAEGRDVRVGGGPTVVRQFLTAGLVDRLHVAIAPVLLGGDQPLWAGLRGWAQDYDVTAEVAESGTVHVTFTRRPAAVEGREGGVVGSGA